MQKDIADFIRQKAAAKTAYPSVNFQDVIEALYSMKSKIYKAEFVAQIQDWGASIVRVTDTSNLTGIDTAPRSLKRLSKSSEYCNTSF